MTHKIKWTSEFTKILDMAGISEDQRAFLRATENSMPPMKVALIQASINSLSEAFKSGLLSNDDCIDLARQIKSIFAEDTSSQPIEIMVDDEQVARYFEAIKSDVDAFDRQLSHLEIQDCLSVQEKPFSHLFLSSKESMGFYGWAMNTKISQEIKGLCKDNKALSIVIHVPSCLIPSEMGLDARELGQISFKTKRVVVEEHGLIISMKSETEKLNFFVPYHAILSVENAKGKMLLLVQSDLWKILGSEIANQSSADKEADSNLLVLAKDQRTRQMAKFFDDEIGRRYSAVFPLYKFSDLSTIVGLLDADELTDIQRLCELNTLAPQ